MTPLAWPLMPYRHVNVSHLLRPKHVCLIEKEHSLYAAEVIGAQAFDDSIHKKQNKFESKLHSDKASSIQQQYFNQNCQQ